MILFLDNFIFVAFCVKLRHPQFHPIEKPFIFHTSKSKDSVILAEFLPFLDTHF